MRSVAIALLLGGALLISAGALGRHNTTLFGPGDDPSPIRRQLAGSFHSSNAKGGDKLMSRLAGGRYGIGGSEPKAKYFKNRLKKIPRCCANSQ